MTSPRHRLPRRQVAACIAVLCSVLTPAAMALQSGEGIVTIGHTPSGTDGTFDVAFGQDARIVFDQAAALLSAGGEIHVLPGTYEFSSTFTVQAEHMTIRGSRGAVITPAANFGGTLLVCAEDRFTLEGLTLHDGRSASIVARAPMVDLEGSVHRLKDLGIRVDEAPGNGAAFIVIDHGNFGSTGSSGMLFEANEIVLGAKPPGAVQTSGLTVLRSTNSTGVRMIDNVARPSGPGRAYLGELVHFSDSWFGTIGGNQFRRLGDDDVEGAVIHITNTAAVEGHHTAITANVFDDCRARRALKTSGLHGFHAIEGNLFLAGRGSILLDSGSDFVLSANVFIDVAPAGTDAVVELLAARAFSLEGNQFRGCTAQAVSATQSRHGKLLGNQFQWDTGTLPVLAPVSLQTSGMTAVGFRVIGNSAIDYDQFGSSVWGQSVLFPVPQSPTSKVVSNYQE